MGEDDPCPSSAYSRTVSDKLTSAGGDAPAQLCSRRQTRTEEHADRRVGGIVAPTRYISQSRPAAASSEAGAGSEHVVDHRL